MRPGTQPGLIVCRGVRIQFCMSATSQSTYEFKIKLPNGNEEIVIVQAQTEDNARQLFALVYKDAPLVYGPAKRPDPVPPKDSAKKK